jgi:hypothetical protein
LLSMATDAANFRSAARSWFSRTRKHSMSHGFWS